MAPQHYSVTKFKVLDLQHHVFDHPIPNGGEGAFLFQHAFAASYGGDSPNPLCSNTTCPDTPDPPDGGSQEYSFVEWDPDKPPTQPNAKKSVTKVNMSTAKSLATGEKAVGKNATEKATEKKLTGKKATMNDRERCSAKSTVERNMKIKGKGRKTNAKKKTDGKKTTGGKKKTDGEKEMGEGAGDSMALDSQHRGRSDDVPPPAQVAPGSSGATRAPTASQAAPAAHGPYHYSSVGDGEGARPATLAVSPQGWSDYPDQEDTAAASAAALAQITALLAPAQASYQDPHFYAGSRPTPAAWEHTAAPAVPAQDWNNYPCFNEQIPPSTNAYRPADAFAVAAQGRQYSLYPDEIAAASAAAPVHSAASPVAVQSQRYSPFPYPVPAGATWQQAAEIASLLQEWHQTSSQTDQGTGTEEVAWTPTAGLGVPVQGEDYGLLTDFSAEAIALETVAHGGYSYPRTDEELGPTDAYAPTYAPTTPGLEQDRESSSDDGLLTPQEPPTVDGFFEPWWALSDKDAFARIFAHLE